MNELEAFRSEFRRYRQLGEKALAQVGDDTINRVLVEETNSIAMILRHVGGNLVSRFTDFLTTDGEKPWRNRDSEFQEVAYARSEAETFWREGWTILEETLAQLTPADLDRQVTIRGVALSVHEALARSVAHIAYHVGQIVLLARLAKGAEWDSLSIPRGESDSYNQAPRREKA